MKVGQSRIQGQLSWLTTISGSQIVDKSRVAFAVISGRKPGQILLSGLRLAGICSLALKFSGKYPKTYPTGRFSGSYLGTYLLGALKWPQPSTPMSIR
jgi:hypothetical protein